MAIDPPQGTRASAGESVDTLSHPASVRTAFEQRWRERFVEFAQAREDDAGIAGWSLSGLETRFRLFRRCWRAPAAGASYLDVGCGAGTYSRWLVEQGLRVVGVDYSQPTLIKARARLPAAVALCVGDASRLPLPDAIFDGALCFGVLQALSDSRKVIAELARVLKPGGELWIDALNAHGLAARFEKARLRLKGKSMHLRYESPTQVSKMVSEAGFDRIRLYWLPILPARLRSLQPLIESGVAGSVFTCLPVTGKLMNHAFALHARRSKE